MAQKSGFDFFGFGDRLGGEGEVREKFWRTAKRAARQIPFMEDVVAAYYCAMDKNTPLRAKGILVAALGCRGKRFVNAARTQHWRLPAIHLSILESEAKTRV
ncbi:YkvA family protein [Mesorhizobium sp. B1-1-4]|uniref:YkvA family protein n=1 Tax=Mesorhizobium sp. B1-1-4 TaxID=2589980 RepID=UPI001FF03D23|nr:YkvA family protein [Mesorhizobium sp. B1-1-4]